jgi:hypothetical protein
MEFDTLRQDRQHRLCNQSACSSPAGGRFSPAPYSLSLTRLTMLTVLTVSCNWSLDVWRAVVPVQGTEDDDLSAALDGVKKHRLAFWDAMLWAAAQRAGVRHLVTEDLQDGFELAGVRFVNPFDAANNRLIDEILPPG